MDFNFEELKKQVKQLDQIKQEIKDSYYYWEVTEGFFSCIRRIRHFFYKIWKTFKYLPTIWKDEDWDYEYILDLLDKKLSFVEKRFDKVGYEKEVAQIKETRRYLRNFIDPDTWYAKEAKEEPFPITYDITNGSLVTIREDTGAPLTDEEEKEHLDYLKEVYTYQQEQWNKFWDSCKENMSGWWD